MSGPEILASVQAIAARESETVVLQSGEDEGLDPGWLADIVREITNRHDMAVTLSVGERPRKDYELWRRRARTGSC